MRLGSPGVVRGLIACHHQQSSVTTTKQQKRQVSSTTRKTTATAAEPAAAATSHHQMMPMFDHQMSPSASKMPVFYRAPLYFDRVAVTDSDGDFTYEDIFRRSCKLASELRLSLGGGNPDVQSRVCILCPKGVSFVVAQWAVWMSGHIAVPVLSEHSREAIQYFVNNSNADAV